MGLEQKLRDYRNGFIPSHLEIREQPELKVFPFHVFFAKHMVKNRKIFLVSVVYKPDLKSFKLSGKKYSMEYRNDYGRSSWLVIEYNLANKSYAGKRVINGKPGKIVKGKKWETFFPRFTMPGPIKGEDCKFNAVGLLAEAIEQKNQLVMDKENKRKFNRCSKCGEYKGEIRERYTEAPYLWNDKNGNEYITVSCICKGIPCPKCRKNKIHRPISNSYDPLDGHVWHSPYFSAMVGCSECRNKKI